MCMKDHLFKVARRASMAPKRRADDGLIPTGTVKRVMQEDEDVGTLAELSCVLVGKSTELFVRDLLAAAAADAHARGSAEVDVADVQAAVSRTELFDFLRETVDSVATRAPTASKSSGRRAQGRAPARGVASSEGSRAGGAAGSSAPPTTGWQRAGVQNQSLQR
jgi:hypothetical protein